MKIAAIGECMMELSCPAFSPDIEKAPAVIGYGGDTLNTAVYLARIGSKSTFVSAVGHDHASAWMISQWQKSGVDTSLVVMDEHHSPGLYAISNDESGERYFTYWRNDSAARYILSSDKKMKELLLNMADFDLVYFSGISLAILDDSSRERLFSLLRVLRSDGKKVAFDGNYRPTLWEEVEVAKDAFNTAYAHCDIALPTLEDESMLFGDGDKDGVLDRILSAGTREVVLKMGGRGCCIGNGERRQVVPGRQVQVVDTTSAGDSFNAAYLHHRLGGESQENSAKMGHVLASTVIQYKGAIIPENSMPKFQMM